MKTTVMNRGSISLWAIVAALGFTLPGDPATAQSAAIGHAADSAAEAAATASTPKLRVLVDPRIELVSLIFRLAGNPEYNQARVDGYTADVEKQFDRFRDHPVVKLARQLRNTRGVSYDACMNLAILLSEISDPRLTVPLQPWPDFLDRRWTAASATNFVVLAGQFVKDCGFEGFIKAHHSLYATTASRMEHLMAGEGHLDWFTTFFGERPSAQFTVVLGMLNGPCCYGPHCRDSRGNEDLFCILGVWATDDQGVPVFSKDVLPTVVHEFCHSFANPLIDRHCAELQAAGAKLFGPVADQMRSHAYGDAQAMLRESLVRASVVRYLRHYGGAEAAALEIRAQKRRGFLWMQQLSDLLGQYEQQRNQYPTLEAFAPRLVAFFDEYAKTFAKDQADLDAKRPKVLSVAPANGATDVEPGEQQIRVVFDRPMRDGAWAMCGGGPHFPEIIGQPAYDPQRTTWSVRVKLKPNWEYEYSLNAGEFQSFQSQEGVPLKPLPVKFKTRAQGLP